MSLAGLFLMVYLFVHLSINLLILFDRGLFLEASHFMGTNPFIQTFQWVLFAGFAIHMIVGVILQIQNWMARPKGYKKKAVSEENYFSKFMIHTGVIIGIFLFIHLADFFLKKIAGTIPEIQHGEFSGIEDMGFMVIQKFKIPGYVIFYVLAFLFLGFHLDHAFQSAFQSLGLSHRKYDSFITWLSHIIAIVLTIGFISIPITIYFFK